jgi:hypothetical protein
VEISAIVVGRNEGHLLLRCFNSLRFCSEILYGDLNSNDNSVELAKQFDAKVFSFQEFGPAGEYTQAKLINKASNEWVIVIDPDEVIDQSLSSQLLAMEDILKKDDLISSVSVPWKFYFKKKPLKGTVWGHSNRKVIMMNKNRFEFNPITHYGRRPKKGFDIFYLELNGSRTNVLHHFWSDSYKLLWKKHRKYLKDEGKDRFQLGKRVSLKSLVLTPWSEFFLCFISKKGYLDGMRGFWLSLLWSYYQTYSDWGVYVIGKKLRFKDSVE